MKKQKKLQLNISEFKAKALRYIAEVDRSGNEIIILKKGKPIVKVVPLRVEATPLRGMLKGKLHCDDDIIHFDTSEDWDALK